jgi:hypothetical protein
MEGELESFSEYPFRKDEISALRCSRTRGHSRPGGVEPQCKLLHPQPIIGNVALHPSSIAKGKAAWIGMITCGTNHRHLAEAAEDPLIKQEHFELAAICEEVANHIEDRRTGG